MSELIPTQQKEVTFFEGTTITAVLIDADVYASINSMCDALELDRQAQRRRIERSDVLNDGQRVAKLATLSSGMQDTYVLRADLVPLWLAGVRTKAINSSQKQKLIDFQKRAAKVLWDAFRTGQLTNDVPSIDDLAAEIMPLEEVYQVGLAIAALAKSHMALRQQQAMNTSQLADHEQRLETLETALTSPQRVISEAQANQLSQAVKNVAMILSKKTKRNEYGGVFGELYRRYNVTSYKSLPASKFDEAAAWLREWLYQLESDTF